MLIIIDFFNASLKQRVICLQIKNLSEVLAMKIDETDAKILRTLLKDGRSKLVDIAKDCKLSSTAIKNRIVLMKKSGLIVKPVLNLNMAFFKYPLIVLIGVNLDPKQEQKIIKIFKKHAQVAGIDRTIGKYDLCLFVFAKNISDLDRLKSLIRNQRSVKNIDVNIWDELYMNYSNVDLKIGA